MADAGNNAYRKIAPDQTVTTVAGSATPGYDDGIGTNATFRNPTDVIMVDDKMLIVSDLFKVRKISLQDGRVTTLAGTPSPGGHVDGPALSAKLNGNEQITIFNNQIFVTNAGTRVIRKISESPF